MYENFCHFIVGIWSRSTNKKTYEFPVLYTSSMKEAKKAFQFSSFPHVILIKDGKIRFSGYPNYNSYLNSLEREIENLLNE